MINLGLIDFSDYSRGVLDFADHWSAGTGVELRLLHDVNMVVPAFADQVDRQQLIDQESDFARKKIQELINTKKRASGDINIHVSNGSLMDTIGMLHTNRDINMMFAGLKGAGFWKQILLGSTVVDLTNNFDIPVVAVPRNMPIQQSYHLYMAINYQYPLDRDFFERFLKQNSTLLREVTFVTVVSSEEKKEHANKYIEEIEKHFRNYPVSHSLIYSKDRMGELKKLVAEKPDTLLGVQKGSRNFFDYIFRRFFVNELVYDGSTPMIILP